MTAATGTASSTTGTTGWTNPSNVYTSNNSYTVSASIVNSGVTGFLHVRGHGFAIPTGATIDGLEVAIEAKNQLSGSGFQCRPPSGELRFVDGVGDLTGIPPSMNTQAWSLTTDVTRTFGGNTNLWGGTFTPAIINDTSFGIRVRFFNINASTQTFSVDSIIVTVYYTDGGVSSSQQQFFMYEF